MIMWDPATYPDVKAIGDLKPATHGALLRRRHLHELPAGAGVLKRTRPTAATTAPRPTSSPTAGKAAQQGFATARAVRIRERDRRVEEAGRVSSSSTITGYPHLHSRPYPCGPAIWKRTPHASRSWCRCCSSGAVDYLATTCRRRQGDPRSGRAVRDRLGLLPAQRGLRREDDEGPKLVSDGPDGTIGDFDQARVQRIIDVTTPIFTERAPRPPAV